MKNTIKPYWLILLIIAIIFTLSPRPVQAHPDEWSRFPIPLKGGDGGWALTSDTTTEGTGITAVAVASDGTIFTATEETDGSPLKGYNLFQSQDGGYTWTPLWKIPAEDEPAGATETSKVISLVLPGGEHVGTLFLATQYNVYYSTDGGRNFSTIGSRPVYADGATVDNKRLISSLAVTYRNNRHLLMIGASDADDGAGDYGGAFLYDEARPLDPWMDLRAGNGDAGTEYDVLSVAFSPEFTRDQQFIALVSDDVAPVTQVITKQGTGGWGAAISDAELGAFASVEGGLAFPSDFESDPSGDKYLFYAGVDAVTFGAMYIIAGANTPDNSPALPMSAPSLSGRVHSMAAAGPITGGVVIAGLKNGGILASGLPSQTPPAPSTATNAVVAVGKSLQSGYEVYAGTSGVGGGFAQSIDSGQTFHQTALISDDIMSIVDMAISPVYERDGTVYLITEGNSGNSILWRTAGRGNKWDAVLISGQEIISGGNTVAVGAFDKVTLSPNFTADTTLFIAEEGDAPSIWISTDNGFRFSRLRSKTGSAGSIGDWVILDNRTVFVGDSLGDFYYTDNTGLTWSEPVASGLSDFSSMTLSPDYASDSTIAAAGNDGKIVISKDGGSNWKSAASPTGLGDGTIAAFSPFYQEDKTIYAADVATDTGILRLVGDSEEWQRIDQSSPYRIEEVTGPGRPGITGLEIVRNNDRSILYATQSAPVVKRIVGTTEAEGGIARSLNPASPLSPAAEAPVFETVNRSLPLGATMTGLWHAEGASLLWSVNTGADPDVLYYYEDTMTGPVEPVSPQDGSSPARQNSVELSWSEVDNATSYNVEYDNYIQLSNSNQVYSERTDVTISDLESGTDYFWQVRVGQKGNSVYTGADITYGAPVLSPFSEIRKFTTAPGADEWSPFTDIEGISPPPGSTGLSLRPTFQWNPASGVTAYDFILSESRETNASGTFTNPVIAKTGAQSLTAPVFQLDSNLKYGTTYYWQVRATSEAGHSQWANGIFTTEPTPAEPPQPTPPPTPSFSVIPPPVPPAAPTPFYIWIAIGVLSLLVIAALALIYTTRKS